MVYCIYTRVTHNSLHLSACEVSGQNLFRKSLSFLNPSSLTNTRNAVFLPNFRGDDSGHRAILLCLLHANLNYLISTTQCLLGPLSQRLGVE
jgi:hypothetical protein